MALATLTRKPIALLGRNSADPRAHVDWGLLIGTLLLVSAGLVSIYTATYQNRSIAGLDTLYFVKRQGLALVVGLIGMGIVMAIDYHRLRQFSLVLYLGILGMLAAVLVVARAHNGADAWFDFGPFQLQPSELAKVVLVLVLAGYVANERGGGTLPFPRFVAALGILALPAGLVLVQPDLGTASALVVIAMAILLVAGAHWRHIALITGMALLSGGRAHRHRPARPGPAEPAVELPGPRRGPPLEVRGRRPAPGHELQGRHRRRRRDRAGLPQRRLHQRRLRP